MQRLRGGSQDLPRTASAPAPEEPDSSSKRRGRVLSALLAKGAGRRKEAPRREPAAQGRASEDDSDAVTESSVGADAPLDSHAVFSPSWDKEHARRHGGSPPFPLLREAPVLADIDLTKVPYRGTMIDSSEDEEEVTSAVG